MIKTHHFVFLILLALFSNSIYASTQEASTTGPVCGNSIVESGEQCDDTDLNGATCALQGFSGGTLSCSASCNFNTSSCTSGGGGGGGGGGSIPPASSTAVNFSGKAYPKSVVTILKDAQIVTTVAAGTDANFSTLITSLSAGNYIFSVYSEDKDGRRSGLLTFPVSVTAGATTNISGIFLAPTIAVDKKEVKRGDNIAIFGQSAIQSDIIISVNSEEEFFAKTISDKDGIYLYNFDTSVLEYGSHNTKSKASIGNQLVSGFSPLINFKVSTQNIPAQLPPQAPAKGDLDTNSRVNLVDFSIVAYWYKKSNPPVKVDLNNDRVVNLIDFSIMAFYWTG